MTNLIHVPTHPTLKLGRLPSAPAKHPLIVPFDLVRGSSEHIRLLMRETGPASFDYRDGLPDSTGVLHNDTLGCCTAAAKGHRAQQFTSYRKLPPLDGDKLAASVIQFYSETTGYDPNATLNADGTNPTDQGGDMQKIAEYLVETGYPMPDGTRDKFAFALQVDPTNEADLAFCGLHCQGLDFGIVVTTSVMPADGSNPPAVWTTHPDDQQLGGHDVISMARKPNGNWVVDSWGNWYEFDEAFRKQNVDLAFAYVSSDMLEDGKTVMGLDLSAWESIIETHGQCA